MGYLDDFIWITIDEHPKNDDIMYANLYSDQDNLDFDNKQNKDQLNEFLNGLSQFGKNLCINLYDYDDVLNVQREIHDLNEQDVEIKIDS